MTIQDETPDIILNNNSSQCNELNQSSESNNNIFRYDYFIKNNKNELILLTLCLCLQLVVLLVFIEIYEIYTLLSLVDLYSCYIYLL